jgi:hypothetical protein
VLTTRYSQRERQQQEQQVGRKQAPRRALAHNTETDVNQQRTGMTQDLEYIWAPVRERSDDSNDGTYAPSASPGEDEEGQVVLPSIESDKLDESDGSDESEESAKADESEESAEAGESEKPEGAEEPAGPSTPPRQKEKRKGKEKRNATEWSVSPSPIRVKKSRRSETGTKVKDKGKRKATESSISPSPTRVKKSHKSKEETKPKETPIPVPFLHRAIQERARVNALVQENLSAKLSAILPRH